MAATSHRVISADCHINEPPHVFDRVPPEYRDRTPRMMRGEDGGDGWSFDGQPPKRTFGIEAMAGRAKGDFQLQGLRFDEIMPGNYDGAAHVADMERDGVDVSVVYPAHAIFTYIEPDRGLALACLRSYNDWVLEEFQGAAPDRLVGLPMLPVDDGMDVTVAELERVAAKGARGCFIPGMPRRPYNDRYYEPLWRAASETGLALSFHRTFGGAPPDADWDELVEQNVSVAGIVNRFFSGVRPLTYLIFDGVFDRNPNLKIVAAEVNCGWVPFWAQTMDHTLATEGAWAGVELARQPSEYLGENVFVTILDDHVGFDLMRAGFPRLADTCMFSTDYPHSVTLWPDTQKHVAELTAGLDPEDARKVLSGNAERVYGV
ncbi:MAG TPA: amidohydrolase family protein [Acidimicrobiales bacterium]